VKGADAGVEDRIPVRATLAKSQSGGGLRALGWGRVVPEREGQPLSGVHAGGHEQ